MIKPGAWLEGVWVEEARDSQRLLFISKKLQLNTKFYYMEVTVTSGDYKIFLCISKITASENRYSHLPTPYQGKKPKEREKEREEVRVRKRRGEGEREIEGERKRRRKRKKRRKRKEKTEKAVLKSFF